MNHIKAIAAFLMCISTLAPLRSNAAQPEAAPVVSVAPGVTPIADIGFYTVSYRYLDGRTGQQPMGWTGNFETATGIAAMPAGMQNGKSAYLLHPVWRGGVGDTDQTYRLALPRAPQIHLAFSIALKQDAVGKSDGVTFRVFMNGQPLLDQNKATGDWSDFDYDLTKFAGQTVTLTFETDPGPNHRPGFDYAYWGDRRIIVPGGTHSAPPAVQSGTTTPLDALQQGWGDASPTHSMSRQTGPVIRSVTPATATRLLDGCVFQINRLGKAAGSPNAPTIPFGSGAYLDLVASDGTIIASDAPGVRATTTQTAAPDGSVVRTTHYLVGTRALTVITEISRDDDGSVRVRMHSPDPFIAAVHFGNIGPTAYRKIIGVPYLGAVTYHPALKLFSSVTIDFSRSHAGTLDGDTARYDALTDGRRNALDETVYYALSPDLHAVFPTPPSPPSPYREAMSHLVVLDTWGQPFSLYAHLLDEFSDDDLKHFLMIVHVWQNGGFDNQLPDILPPNAGLGGASGLKSLADTARETGNKIALHENYVDFYPNAASYNDTDVARDSNGDKERAWFNPTTKIQSYLMTPTAMSTYASHITTQVHQAFGTTASFLDVHSAITPWGHVDYRPEMQNAGSLQACWNAQRDLWRLFRRVHHGPALGEGLNHWYWSGMLDGVEAQFGIGQDKGEDAPLFVDFDLTKIHPKQINHGMGYVERWLTAPNLDQFTTTSEVDDYRMQEVAFGHSAFVPNKDVSSLPYVWTESHLIRPASEQTATAQAVSIRYDVQGRMLDTNDAIAAGTSFDRVCVHYDHGVTVWANGRNRAWTIPNGTTPVTLPQYGWLERSPGTLIYTATQSGRTVDYAETPGTIFADARPAEDDALTSGGFATPSVHVEQRGPNAFLLAFAWRVHASLPPGQKIFVMLTDDRQAENAGIVTQYPSGIDADSGTWTAGKTLLGSPVPAVLPGGLHDGEYEIKVGIYDPINGGRLALGGRDDGSLRYTVARIRVSNGGNSVAVESSDADALRATPIIDFGNVATDSSVFLSRQSSRTWLLMPFPHDRVFTVRLNIAAITHGTAHASVAALDASGKILGPVMTSTLKAGAKTWTQFSVNAVPNATRYAVNVGN